MMSNVNGVTCLSSERYRGFYIDENCDNFGSTFYSIIKPYAKRIKKDTKEDFHVHITNKKSAYKIVDCYYARDKSRYGRLIRNRATALEYECPVRF